MLYYLLLYLRLCIGLEKIKDGVCVCLLGFQSSRRIMPGDEEELTAGDEDADTFEDFWLS